MTRSLRRTLAVRFAATMALGLVVASAGVLWGSHQVLVHQLDQSLSASAFIALDRLVNSPADPEPPLAAEPAAYTREVNRFLVLRDSTGTPWHALPHFAAELPFDSAAFHVARGGNPSGVRGYAAWRGGPIRVLYRPAGASVLQAAASMEPILLVQRQLALALAAVVLLGTGATLIGAWQLSGSAVRPVKEITDLAIRIQPGTLDQRIAAHADTEEYRGLVAVLNGMLERLDRAFRNQRRLTADVSHELRTPLTALRGEIEVTLRADRSTREYQRVLRSALEEIEHLTTMSEDLLLITRAEARQLDVQRVPIHIEAVAVRQLDHQRRQIEEKGLSVEVAPNGQTGPVSVDPELVDRLIGHLVDNAVKFSPIDGRVRVAALPMEGGVRLQVDDSGPGFAPEDLETCSSRFTGPMPPGAAGREQA